MKLNFYAKIILGFLVLGGGAYYWYAHRKPQLNESEALIKALQSENERLLNSPEAKILREKNMGEIAKRIEAPASEKERVKFLESSIRVLDRNQVQITSEEGQKIISTTLGFLELAVKEKNPKTSRSVTLSIRLLMKLPTQAWSEDSRKRVYSVISGSQGTSLHYAVLELASMWKPLPSVVKEQLRASFGAKDLTDTTQKLQILSKVVDGDAKAGLIVDLEKKLPAIDVRIRPHVIKILGLNAFLLKENNMRTLIEASRKGEGSDWEDVFLFLLESSGSSGSYKTDLERLASAGADPFVRDRARRLLSQLQGGSL